MLAGKRKEIGRELALVSGCLAVARRGYQSGGGLSVRRVLTRPPDVFAEAAFDSLAH